MKEYALYKGEEILSIGTAKQIAKDLKISEKTVRFYGVKAYKKRLKQRKNSQNARRLIKI